MSRPTRDRRQIGRLRVAGAALVVSASALAGCSAAPPIRAADSPRAAASTRPAGKATCADVQWDPPPSLRLEQTSRELVPWSPVLLGVDTTWRAGGFTVETVSGGYMDELTEPYDDLRPTGTRSLEGGLDAQVLHGSFQASPVLLVLWRDPSQPVPCDVHAFLVQGADAPTEGLLLRGLR
jgi:hypothetical protein